MQWYDVKNEFLHNLLSSSYEIEGADEEIPHIAENYLVSEEMRTILLHRETHFSGSFPAMIAYYKKGKKGVQEEILLKDIKTLAKEEDLLGKNIAPLLLTGAEAEKIKAIKAFSEELHALASTSDPSLSLARAISALILSEKEKPTREINAVVSFKETALQPLCDMLFSEKLNDPLFPGYGLAPQYAIEALGKMKKAAAIEPLFLYAHTQGRFFDAVQKAFIRIGTPACTFLKNVASSNQTDTIRCLALSFLLGFGKKLAPFFFSLLKNNKGNPSIAHLCALGLEGLGDKDKAECLALMENNSFSPELVAEIKVSVKK